MRSFFELSASAGLAAMVLLLSAAALAQPSPRSVLGFDPGDDRSIADWRQIHDYFTRLDAASPRVKLRDIGTTTQGRPMIAAFISSESNIRDLERYRQISAKLADPRQLRDGELDKLVAEGKTIVSISCSIHSTEIVASQMSMLLAYELATATDQETKEILANTILILIPSSNPDGIQIVADWYKKTLGTRSEGTSPPELYHHYAGHDNNRDWFMLNLQETRHITKLYWQEWFPQIVYDVHQMGQTGPRFVIPPFYDPPNPRIPASILREVGLIGYKMAADLEAKGVDGVATNTTFDTWWHGGFRSAPYYHNSIGILSEAASADLMTPATVTPEQLRRSRPARGLTSPLERTTAHPSPWNGGLWRPRDIAQIELTASRSLLSLAAKYRSRYLRNFSSIAVSNLALDQSVPRAFVIMAGQPNAEAVAKLIETLTFQGVEVHRMTEELWVKHSKNEEFHEIPLNSFLVFTDQPLKNNVLSLFEKQVYPDRLNANGEPDTPYDVAGWTLPMQLGVENYEVWDIRDLEKKRPSLEKIVSHDQVRAAVNLPKANAFAKHANPLKTSPRIGLYKPYAPSMDEGWTRLVLDTHQIPYKSVMNDTLRAPLADLDVLILPADGENVLANGLSVERYPSEIAGGISDNGVQNLKSFVEDGGTLICLDDSCGYVIKRLGLPVRNVLAGVKRSDFYNPGSIVKISLDRTHALAKGMPADSAAYFINSSAFEVAADASAKIVARYASSEALMSGWMLGETLLNGKAAMVEVPIGQGRIVLFGFRPQHRGQTYATFPLLFNALEKR